MSIKITCRTPSTGKPINILLADVPDTFTTIAEAPYYSVPDASNRYPVRDPAVDTGIRGLREGEIFFVTPLSVRNKSAYAKEISVRIVTEPQTPTEVSKVVEFSKIQVPAGDTALIPLQGRSLFKRTIEQKIVPVVANTALSIESASAELVRTNTPIIINDMWSDLVDNNFVDGWTSYDEAATRRDAALLMGCIKTVLETAVERPILDFARALFYVDTATETVKSYIEVEKKSAFLHSWDFIKDQINGLSGVSSNAQDIVTSLINALKASVNGTYTIEDLVVPAGDLLQIKAEDSEVFDIWISGEEKPANEHSGIDSIEVTE